MSKELEALKEIRCYGCGDVYYKDIFDKDFDIIETALQDYETLKILNENQKHNIEMLMEENRILKERIEKLDKMHTNALNKVANDRNKLKALEIIKKKPQTLYLIATCLDYETYLDISTDFALDEDIYNKEEYDLLKEVLL